MKKARLVTLSVSLLLFMAILSCNGNSRPSNVMDEETMASFLEDAYILEGFYAIQSHYQFDTLQPEMIASYDTLLSRYSITSDDFERSIDWYVHHPEIYHRMCDSVTARLGRRLAKL